MSYEKCDICPRNCGANRENEDTVGFCGETATMRLARAALHFWEEPCISGEAGSGAVFFSGCNLRCVFCQNYRISRSDVGKEVSVEHLAEIFMDLQSQGANNINLVTPTHFIPGIVQALKLAKSQGLTVPIVYNSSGYEKLESLKLLEGLVDIYLPDFKYMDPRLAYSYSQAADYVEVAKAALAEMYRQVGQAQFDEGGMMKKGVIVRHLVLPSHTNDSRDVIRYLYENYGDDIYLSVMSQYTPLDTLDKEHFPELNRSITAREYARVVDFMLSLGVDNAFIQESGVDKESFIPDFDYTGL